MVETAGSPVQGVSAQVLAALLALAGAGAPVPGGAAEIYVSTGEHGEVSFSDTAGPGARPVTVDAPDPATDPQDELERRIRQTLTVAEALEASRLAREAARAEARAADARRQVAVDPARDYDDDYLPYPYLFLPRHHPHHPGRPGDKPGDVPPAQPEPTTPTRSSPMEWRKDGRG